MSLSAPAAWAPAGKREAGPRPSVESVVEMDRELRDAGALEPLLAPFERAPS
ncbi:hypothetical protein ABZ454_26690 [Streptomyces sp. NPDC005803]|uniref:hypothetical protein n=1 Tax=Streptomyces sp. NPDC005803 TaxID=3154297 RepID=UPI0033F79878